MFSLPTLAYDRHALEPHISAKTIDFHYGKHHQTYVDNLNGLITGTELEELTLQEIIKQTAGVAEKTAVFNNAAQVFNHDFYWNCMIKNGSGEPDGLLREHLVRDFGLYENFVQEFKTAATKLFGAGWVWLVLDDTKLKIVSTSNAGTPLTLDMEPLLVIDVWEHAYYLDYQNNRKQYIEHVVNNLIDWKFVQQNYTDAQK